MKSSGLCYGRCRQFYISICLSVNGGIIFTQLEIVLAIRHGSSHCGLTSGLYLCAETANQFSTGLYGIVVRYY